MASDATRLALAVQDRAARVAALEVARSFLVRAPAGSGKTTLLTQRYLALLATVEAPEAILAVTFTRKAAAKMRVEILKALAQAAGAPPEKAHDRKTWELAVAARERAEARGWRLEETPSRLKIQTLDALALSLAQRLPWRSRLGGAPAPTETAEEMYRAAAAACLRRMGTNAVGAAAARRLVDHADADLERAEALLADMLKRRDAWPEVLFAEPEEVAAAAQRELTRLVEGRLARAREELAPFAGELAEVGGLPALPEATMAELPRWRALAGLTLTQKGGVRGRADSRAGLDAAGAKRLKALGLTETACAALHATRGLPEAADFALETALLELLRPAAAELQLEFAARGECDFTEITLRACEALRDEAGAPSALAFALDGRLQHILVDEFQDTSAAQYRLLQALTQDWQPGDGRTLFLVGDPMQSIHRFRNARVELFLRTAEEGRMGATALEQLTLARNFRSQAELVEWANGVFRGIFPAEDDAEIGAARFSAAAAAQETEVEAKVETHAVGGAAGRDEAAVVAELARRELDADAGEIAILVRARTHLRTILPELRRRGIAFEAVKLWTLEESPVARDLLALTQAVFDPADRVAWLAALRAPWCGLTLADLHALCGDLPDGEADATVAELYAARAERLSEDGQQRAARTMEVLNAAARERGRVPARRLMAWCWRALGGEACAPEGANPADAEAMLGLIEAHDHGNGTLDLDRVREEAQKLMAAPEHPTEARVKVMTMHQAKGLEFDTVILPGLGRPPRREDQRLLHWRYRPAAEGAEARLLLAAAPPRGGESPAYKLVQQEEKASNEQETLRLLYVAATRAKRTLHLVAEVKHRNDGELAQPRADSLLRPLWPAVRGELERQAASAQGGGPPAAAAPRENRMLRRVAADWAPAGSPAEVTWAAAAPAAPPAAMQPRHGTAAALARQLGTAAHIVLRRMAGRAPLRWTPGELKQALWAAGVGPAERDEARARLERMLTRMAGDERGRWILAAHEEAHCEWAIQGMTAAGLRQAIVDRSFVDGGVRWVIDYKTGVHEGAGLEAFLDEQAETYKAQLEGYAELLGGLAPLPVRCGLYFPALGAWREWEGGVNPARSHN